MSRGTRIATIFFTVVLAAIFSLFFFVRFHDGPMEIISGGPFTTGEMVDPPSDWSFLEDRMTIELQTMIPPRSRTMWLAVHDERLFVGSNYMNTFIGKLWKQWPKTVARDNRALIRVDGTLYELQLVRITEGDEIEGIIDRFNEKYLAEFSLEGVENGGTWLFELRAR